MANCTGCNSCQSCDKGCQVCNACQSIACNVKQTLCDIKCEMAVQYGDGNPWTNLCFEKDQFITYKNLTSKKIQDAFDWINKACTAGNSALEGGITANWSGTVTNLTALAAAETVTLAEGLKKLGVTISTKSTNDIIYASYFNDIRTKMNENAKISNTACELCNAKCEATCNTCNLCESCQSCDAITYCGEYCGEYCGQYCGQTDTGTGETGS